MTYYMVLFETQTVVKVQLISNHLMPVKSMELLLSIVTTVSQSKPWPAVQ